MRVNLGRIYTDRLLVQGVEGITRIEAIYFIFKHFRLQSLQPKVRGVASHRKPQPHYSGCM
jgi:hypothetical protein